MNDFAVIETGGKQHSVSVGDYLKIEKISDISVGDTLSFDKVLLTSINGQVDLGTPYLNLNKVSAEIISHGKSKKITVLKFKRRKSYLKRQGHRQPYTQIKITSIN